MHDDKRDSNRRLERRIPTGTPATIRLQGGVAIEAECTELGVGGMTLCADYVPKELEVLEVEVAAPAGSLDRPPLRAWLEVRRCHEMEKGGRYEIGGAIVRIVE